MELQNLLEVVKEKTTLVCLRNSQPTDAQTLEKQLQDEDSIYQDIPLNFIVQLKETSRQLENARWIADTLDWKSYFFYTSKSQNKDLSLEMIKLLANCIMQVPIITKQFAHFDSLERFTREVLEGNDIESQIVYLRFLFIFLANRGEDTCINLEELTSCLVKKLEAIWKILPKSSNASEIMLLYTEILRILFPIFRIGSIEEPIMSTALPILISTWSKYSQDEGSMIRWHAINAILECDPKDMVSAQASEVVDLAIRTLDSIVNLDLVETLEGCYHHFEGDLPLNKSLSLERDLVPILVILYSIMSIEGVRKKLETVFLPEESDRKTSLRKGKSLACLFLRLSVIPLMENVPIWHGTILFALCNYNSDLLTNQVGFGYASGILNRVKHFEPSEFNVQEPSSTGATSETDLKSESSKPIDPITGEYQQPKKSGVFSTMTMEEKEREAERLFVLFQRLEKNGAIQVTNPIRQVVDSGSYDEIDDSNSE
ncbi:Ric8 family guanine nucleotide exchange factor synembryn family protein [Schizosaccharomyces cryophilus OY26]|uniref:Ric8 family guanine nucleotide exchange factor synembryn family protein n=1 Tax=Schizosaccharomyces cryophilus (strain OY26 / ATCC MYA-4695 / CBS 11777 / NBRC 106824 / NRRL Y48691) TaxID=653667 RepID=S9XJJ4_SCHCR|nr:Ric8 family guanine nucleotide exchange factor synembryn family protein [Schizosaccharomyces cryophilus OY26]EPY53866.1 Ric8 family guanine nucleotide exchange factor synembryn family protein [Schizosaccharomyces cryophilus OY26]